jgi:NAD(P)H-hydrate repair Nnr-like enzyme with NAD(P)H-hydrate dehydratase domain
METLALPSLPVRKPDSHKGDYGKVLVIAGSETMIGAPAMVALGSLRAGSGLVRIAAPKEIIPAVLTVCPYATAFAWTSTKLKELLAFADEHDVLAVGPGLGTSAGVKRLILELLERHHGPMVFDADALNVLAGLETSEWPKRRNWGNVVMTPHMGEYMRLMGAIMKRGANVALSPEAAGKSSQEDEKPAKKGRSLVDDDDRDDAPSTADGMAVEMHDEEKKEPEALVEKKPEPTEPDRTPLAELLARGTGSVVVLKGHRTVITDASRFAVNTTGNPAMATPGSGDVLTGVIASLIGQKIAPLEAAVLGVHLHGRAGDLAREKYGPNAAGLTAGDIVEHLPWAIAERVAAG